jgi:hypothetical protein
MLEIHQTRTAINSVEAVNGAIRSMPSVLPLVPSGSHIQQIEPTPQWVDNVLLVNLYYLNFHPNHPILVPKRAYWKRDYPCFLKAVVEFIGSHFLQAIPSRTLQEDVTKRLEQEEHDTPAIVQARILYAAILLARNESRLCQQVLAYAVNTATSLGLHRRGFALSHANDQAEEEESLRRTWYELYVLDGCIAASQRNTSFKSDTVDADVLLPAEDSLYEDGMLLPRPKSIADFEDSAFTDEEVVFSSFSYRIGAVRLLGRVLAITGKHGVPRERVQAIDNALAAFLHHLPPSKQETDIVKVSGDIDGLMLQTHMIIQYATILLHFPRGDLVSLGPSAAELPGDSTARFVCPCSRQHVHSLKAIDASRAISMLAALRIPIQRHTPLFIHPLVLCAVVQLSLCTTYKNDSELWQQHRDCVKLILGLLRSMGQYWSTAGLLNRALRKRALGVFRSLRSGAPDPSQPEHCTDDVAFPPLQAYGEEVSSEDTTQLNFNELSEFHDFINFDFPTFCL